MVVNEVKGIQSVERAMSILEAIAAAGGEVRLTELVNSLGLHKSTLHGLLNTLCAMGYISRRDSRYALGLRLREIAQPLNDADMVIKAYFAPALRGFAELSKEQCYLAVPCRTRHYIYIDMIAGNAPLHSSVPRGKREALITSAMGKVFLAFDEDLSRSLRKAGHLTQALEEELRLIRDRWYAFDLEQAEEGLHCMALPLRKQGRLVAAMSLAGPSDRLPEEHLSTIAGKVMREMYDIIKL